MSGSSLMEPTCFISSSEWTNKTLAIEGTSNVFHKFGGYCRFMLGRGWGAGGLLNDCNLQHQC